MAVFFVWRCWVQVMIFLWCGSLSAVRKSPVFYLAVFEILDDVYVLQGVERHVICCLLMINQPFLVLPSSMESTIPCGLDSVTGNLSLFLNFNMTCRLYQPSSAPNADEVSGLIDFHVGLLEFDVFGFHQWHKGIVW